MLGKGNTKRKDGGDDDTITTHRNKSKISKGPVLVRSPETPLASSNNNIPGPSCAAFL